MPLSRINNPFLSSSGAGNASITSPAANTVAFSTATTERMRIDSSGDVGINGALLAGTPGGAAGKVFSLAATQYPQLIMTATSAAAAEKNVRFIYRDNGIFQLQTLDDTYGTEVTAYQVQRSTTGITYQAFYTGTAGSVVERMRINSDGNVGIGTSSPNGFGNRTFEVSAGASAAAYIVVTTASNTIKGEMAIDGGVMYISTKTNHPMVFRTNDAEGMRLDTSRNLQIGTSSNPQSTRLTLKHGSSPNWGIGPLGDSQVFYVINDSGSGVQLTSGNQSWAAQSDERVKTDLVPIENGLAKVTTLRAVVGRLKNDTSGRRLPFLIAQDVQAVLPEAIDTGEDEDKILSLRYTDVIPLLVASIKELKAINDTQAATITALTARVDAQAATITTLTTRVDTQAETITALTARVDTQAANIAELKTKVA